MRAYKVFKVKDGRLFSAFVEKKARIKYSPGKKSIGRTFQHRDGYKISLPIFACEDWISACKIKSQFEETLPSCGPCYEIWEVEGKEYHKKFRFGFVPNLELGEYHPTSYSFPPGTIFLRTCMPIRRIE